MVEEFLLKEQEEHLNSKLDLESSRDQLVSKIKENKKFIDVLSANNETFFQEFTPRDLAVHNKDKIQELEDELEELEENLEIIKNDIAIEENKLEEIAKVIANYKESKPSTKDDLEMVSIGKLENILAYLPSDPIRARLELQEIINSKKL